MSIKISSFLGRFGYEARRIAPNLAAAAYLKLQFATRSHDGDAFCKWFVEQDQVPMPQVVNIETINRCNSTCSFCPASVKCEKRPLCKISDDLYHSIIDQLADWGYEGHLTLYGNNEPLLDTEIVERHRYAREKLPKSFIFMSTNGLILTLDKIRELQPYLDQLIINNYAHEYKLHKNVQEIYDYIKAHPAEFEDLEIIIQMRYLGEVLTNRAGAAPNKQATEKVYTQTCLLPYTDLWITPNGKVGICCCDSLEVTDFGDVSTTPVKEVWEGPKLQGLRKAIVEGRHKYPFCKNCDFIDAGFRTDMIKLVMKGDQAAANRIGGEEKKNRKK
ncbi:MAG: SPASM domain-containing protein [Lachnospiraceae bacterium]|nr:SPASM domain-containing protein [Lachnospiraceae bacterium]